MTPHEAVVERLVITLIMQAHELRGRDDAIARVLEYRGSYAWRHREEIVRTILAALADCPEAVEIMAAAYTTAFDETPVFKAPRDRSNAIRAALAALAGRGT